MKLLILSLLVLSWLTTGHARVVEVTVTNSFAGAYSLQLSSPFVYLYQLPPNGQYVFPWDIGDSDTIQYKYSSEPTWSYKSISPEENAVHFFFVDAATTGDQDTMYVQTMRKTVDVSTGHVNTDLISKSLVVGVALIVVPLTFLLLVRYAKKGTAVGGAL